MDKMNRFQSMNLGDSTVSTDRDKTRKVLIRKM